jgi:ABC-type antimicrobial peptide transport system permease subunit
MGTPRLLSDAVREAEARPLWLAGVLGAFAVAAAGLTLVGLYGVVAYAVRLREREVAVRMALGANAAAVTAQFVVEGWRILAAGLLFGALAALGLGRVLESQLFGVAARDPIVLALAALLLAGAGSLAMWWPARRAASLDPAALLKQE